jgi:thiosulfate/3-mercaptopyruvate sulfurtransferase
MGGKIMSALISAADLQKILGQPHLKLLDASYHLPPSTQGIAGALDFDIDDVAVHHAPFAHTIPPAHIFSDKVGALGIGNDDLVIVYDRSGISMAAARVWWMFRLFGHDNVKILDGGLPAWIRAGHAVEEKPLKKPPAAFEAAFQPHLVKLTDQIEENVSARNFILLDARDAGRFKGDVPDPRPHVRAGHIPGALNVPFTSLLNPDGTMKPKDQLEKSFHAAATPLESNLACSCGSGVTACVVALALYELGRPDVAVYDGSWTEWGSNSALPVAKGH